MTIKELKQQLDRFDENTEVATSIYNVIANEIYVSGKIVVVMNEGIVWIDSIVNEVEKVMDTGDEDD